MNVMRSGQHLNSVVVWRWTNTWRLTWIQAPWELIWDNHYLNDLLLIVHDHPLLPNLKHTKCSRYEGIMHTRRTCRKSNLNVSVTQQRHLAVKTSISAICCNIIPHHTHVISHHSIHHNCCWPRWSRMSSCWQAARSTTCTHTRGQAPCQLDKAGMLQMPHNPCLISFDCLFEIMFMLLK